MNRRISEQMLSIIGNFCTIAAISQYVVAKASGDGHWNGVRMKFHSQKFIAGSNKMHSILAENSWYGKYGFDVIYIIFTFSYTCK